MKSLRLHPFARRIVASCHQLNGQRLAPGTQSRLTALDETEQLLWTTPEGQAFAQLSAEHLSVLSFEGFQENTSTVSRLSIPSSTHLAQCFWERDAQLLKLQADASVVLQSYAPHAVAWAQLALTHQFSICSLPQEFHVLLLPSLEPDALLRAMKKRADAAEPTNLILSPLEAPIILATSPEQSVAQLLWLEAFSQTRLLVAQHSSP